MPEPAPKARPWVLYLAILTVPVVLGLVALDRLRPRGQQHDGASAAIAASKYQVEPMAPTAAEPSNAHAQADMRSSMANMQALLDWLGAQLDVPFRPGELIAGFNDRAEENAWAARLREMGFNVIGRVELPGGGTMLRLGFSGISPLEKLSAVAEFGEEPFDLGLNYLYTSPTPSAPARGDDGLAGTTPTREQTLALMGAQPDAGWGAGVKVAVLDSGLYPHPVFGGRMPGLVDLLGGGDTTGSHGTAVASLIAGSNIGVAPGAEVTMYRVLSEGGVGDAFSVAQGIYAAVAGGASILNLSLGGAGDSPYVRQAVDYALASGAVVVAAVGNDGVTAVSYPAAYTGVIGVTTVDATYNLVSFANVGPGVDIAAPGLGVWAASTRDDYMVSFSGTSASTPLVSGAIAAVMSQRGVNAVQAAEIVLKSANDYGVPGADNYLGGGTLDVGRALNSGTKGVLDAAAVGAIATKGSSNSAGSNVTVGVQNRGTQTITQAVVKLESGGFTYTSTVGNLAPGQTGTATFQWPSTRFGNTGKAEATLSVQMPGTRDAQPANDTRKIVVVKP